VLGPRFQSFEKKTTKETHTKPVQKKVVNSKQKQNPIKRCSRLATKRKTQIGEEAGQ